MLHIMYFVKSTGGLIFGMKKSGEYHVVGGTQSISKAILRSEQFIVKLSHPVVGIRQTATGVVVEAKENGEGESLHFTAKFVIQAIPTPFSADIVYQPEMDETRQQLIRNTHMGIYTKVHFLCPERYWADKTLTTEKFLFAGMNPNGPLVIFADGSYPAGKGDTAMLVGFLIPPSADLWMQQTEEERRIAAAKELHHMLDKRPVADSMGQYANCEYHENRWEEDPWGRGVTVVVTSGTLHLYGSAFVRPQGRIHFAGSDSSPVWHGYMEGALFSGERAAAEVAVLLADEEGHTEDAEVEHSETRELPAHDDGIEDENFDIFDGFTTELHAVETAVTATATTGATGAVAQERFRALEHIAEAKIIAKKHREHHHARKQAKAAARNAKATKHHGLRHNKLRHHEKKHK